MQIAYNKKRLVQLFLQVAALALLYAGLTSLKEQEAAAPVSNRSMPAFSWNDRRKVTVFTSGLDSVNSYRIPSLVTTKKGSLLLFCEARKESWKDKGPTDIVVKRSTDNGTKWSAVKFLTRGGEAAFMDPTAVADTCTGKIFLFMTRWPSNDHSGLKNTAWMTESEDDGLSWSAPRDVTMEIVAPGHFIDGFGPGAGFQVKGGAYKGRLIMPTRQTNGARIRNRTLYSDDQGKTWKTGNEAGRGGEFQIAESPLGVLVNNMRSNGKRYSAKSLDGGSSWTDYLEEPGLKTIARGCQGSVLGEDSILLYSGPAGGIANDTIDDRSNLVMYRSTNGGADWSRQYLLYNRASGYSCMAKCRDGRLALVFETADTQGFTRFRGKRPTGWMRLDVVILPKTVFSKNDWLNNSSLQQRSIKYSIHFGQDDRLSVGDHDRMLVLRHLAAPVAHHRPSIVELHGIGGCCGNKGFDRHNRIFPEPSLVKAVPVVQQISRIFMKTTADPVPSQVFDHFVTMFPRFCFHQVADICNFYSALYIADRLAQDLF